MKKSLLISLTAVIALVAAGNAQAGLATFSEDFQSYGANTAFPGTPYLQASYNGAGTAGKILESNGNRYFSVDTQDHDLWLAQAPGAENFQISFRQNQSAANDWNRVFAVYWTGTGGNHVVQMTRNATGIGFGDVAGSTGATPLAIPGSGAITDWLWFRITRTGPSLKIEGSTTNAFINAPFRTVTLPGATNITLMGWKWQPTINVDDIKMAAVPEPATMSMLAIGGLLAMRRRRR